MHHFLNGVASRSSERPQSHTRAPSRLRKLPSKSSAGPSPVSTEAGAPVASKVLQDVLRCVCLCGTAVAAVAVTLVEGRTHRGTGSLASHDRGPSEAVLRGHKQGHKTAVILRAHTGAVHTGAHTVWCLCAPLCTPCRPYCAPVWAPAHGGAHSVLAARAHDHRRADRQTPRRIPRECRSPNE